MEIYPLPQGVSPSEFFEAQRQVAKWPFQQLARLVTGRNRKVAR